MAAGRALRALAAAAIAAPYRLRFRRLGRRPRLFPPLLVTGARSIELGDDTRVEAFASLAVARGGRMQIGAQCGIRSLHDSRPTKDTSSLATAAALNPFCLLNGYGGLRIGSDVRIASHSVVLSSSHKYDDPSRAIQSQGVASKGTQIGDDVWVGSHWVIVGGVQVGSHSIVGAGSVVLDDVPPYAIVAGVPARVIRMRAE